MHLQREGSNIARYLPTFRILNQILQIPNSSYTIYRLTGAIKWNILGENNVKR